MSKKLLSLMVTAVLLSAGTAGAEKVVSKPVFSTKTNQYNEMYETRHFDKGRHKQMAEDMAKELGLSAEQVNKAEKIRRKGFEKIKPLMNEMAKLREEMDKERRINMEEFEKILTSEQKSKFNEIKKNASTNFLKRKHGVLLEHKMMRGMHEMAPAYQKSAAMPLHDGIKMPHHDKHFEKKRRHEEKKHHKNKGGFVDNKFFTESIESETGGFIEE